jgi:hypothetical protein
LLNLHKKSWVDGLSLEDYNTHCTNNEKTVKEMLELAKNYHKVCVGRNITLFHTGFWQLYIQRVTSFYFVYFNCSKRDNSNKFSLCYMLYLEEISRYEATNVLIIFRSGD